MMMGVVPAAVLAETDGEEVGEDDIDADTDIEVEVLLLGEPVVETLTLLLPLSERERVLDGDSVGDALELADDDCVNDAITDAVADGDRVGVTDKPFVGECEGEGVCVAAGVGEGDIE